MAYLEPFTAYHPGSMSPHDHEGVGMQLLCNNTGCVHSHTCPLSSPQSSVGGTASSEQYGYPTSFIPSSTSAPSCIFFPQGRCSKGDNCRFSHIVSNTAAKSQSTHCKFFQQGLCSKGDNCSFIHTAIETAESSDSSSSSSRNSERVDEPTPDTSPGTESSNYSVKPDIGIASDHLPPDQCHSRRSSSASDDRCVPPRASTISVAAAVFEPCTFYATGHCNRGDLCVMHHDEPPEPLDLAAGPEALPDDSGWAQFSDEVIAQASYYDQVPICPYYFFQGTCIMGDMCRYQHIPSNYSPVPLEPNSPVDHIAPRTRKPCKYFLEGTCTKGVHCVFAHDTPMQSTNSWQSGNINHKPKSATCRYFAEGRCRKGDKCIFAHDSGEESRADAQTWGAEENQASTSRSWLDDTDDPWGVKQPSATTWGTAAEEVHPTEHASELHNWTQEETQPSSSLNWADDVDNNLAWDVGEVPKVEGHTDPPEKSQTSPSHNWVDDTDEPWAVDQQPAAKWATSADDVPVKTGKRNRNKNAGSSVCWTRNINDTEWALEPDADGANPSPHVVEDNGSDLLEPTDEYPVDQQDAQKWITTEIDVAEDTRSAEQTWDAPWPEADPAIKPTRSRAKCKYFGQGDCHWGDACNFRHVIDQPSHHWDYADQNVGGDHGVEGVEEPEPPQELPTIDPPPVIEPDNPRSMYHCTVHFGAGAVPERVVTAFESHRLILSNLPAGFAHADLLELAGQYGTVNNTMFHLTSAGMQAHVEFEEKSQAADAALRLNGFAIDELVLNARIDSASYVSSRIYDDGSRQIKLVWAAPSVSGWAFYPTITLAKAESSRLNGSVLGARKITATYQSPKRNQTHSFAVHFAGLPLHVDRARLQTFCPGADSVALNAPNYHAAQNGSIRACLAAFGPVVSFVALPTDSADLEIVAFAEFGTARAAADARSRLDGVPHEFLGNGSISVKAVFHSKYTCPARRFALIRDELKRLRAPCADGCTVQYYEQQDEPCTVHVYGRRLKVVAQVRNAVQRLLFGCEVGCWDSFFDTASSDEALRNLNTADAPFFIHNDRRARVLRLWGDREQGEKRLSRLNKYIQAKRHRLALDDGALAAVLRGGLQALHDEFGESKVVLDVRGRELTVLGDVQRLRLVEERVRALAPPSPESCAEAGGVCALCAAAAAAEHVTLACTHVYCAGCLTHLLRPVPGVEFTPPTCVAQVDGASLPCLAPIPLAVVGAQLSASEQALLFDAALLSYVRANAELRFCVSGCGTLYRGGGVPGTVITCPECLMRLCPCCDVPFHEGLTCVQYQTLDEEDPV